MNTNINTGGDGGNSGMAFIVGGLVVVVALIGFVVAGGFWPFERGGGDVSVRIEQPAPAPEPTPAPTTGQDSGTGSSTTTSGAADSTSTTTTTTN